MPKAKYVYTILGVHEIDMESKEPFVIGVTTTADKAMKMLRCTFDDNSVNKRKYPDVKYSARGAVIEHTFEIRYNKQIYSIKIERHEVNK